MSIRKVVVLGAGGHARVVVECIDKQEYEIVGYLDKDNSCVGEIIEGIPIIGQDSSPNYWKAAGIEGCIIGIGHVGNYKIRNRLFDIYHAEGFSMINAIHKTSCISSSVIIGKGNAIMPGVVINSNAKIGNNAIINSGAIIEHDVVIGDGVHIAPGCTVCGATSIGNNTFIGAGSTIIQGLQIGANSIIGAGSVVITDIPDNVIAVGNPVRIIKRV